MSLRLQAEADLSFILEDATAGFGWAITVTNPAGESRSLTGFSNDVAQFIDPDTGQVVSGRQASVALRLSSIYEQGFELPRGIADSSLKPWLVQFDDINGSAYTFKVAESNPDRALGIITLLLELYE